MRKRTKIIWNIGLPGIKTWMKLRYDIHVKGSFPQPPFLLLANHTENIDPFFILATIGKPVSFVINKAAFQNPIVGFVLRGIDSIPKQKSTSDMKTVIGIFRWLKSGRIVGIFPEGHATWTGESMEAYGGTAKLLDKVSIPIVTCTINGGYLVNPRWAKKRRKGPIELTIKTHEGSQALEAIKVSDWKWQEEKGYRYKGKNKALGIEKIMWFCPECKSYRTIRGKGDRVYCTHCNFSTIVLDSGKIGEFTVKEILDSQRNLLEAFLKSHEANLLFEKCAIKIWGKQRALRLKKQRGSLLITKEALIFGDDVFSFSEIKGLNTFVSTVLEFLYEGKLIRIKTQHNSLLLFNVLKSLGVH